MTKIWRIVEEQQQCENIVHRVVSRTIVILIVVTSGSQRYVVKVGFNHTIQVMFDSMKNHWVASYRLDETDVVNYPHLFGLMC